MNQKLQSFTILVADDDIDDQELIKTALEECRKDFRVHAVSNGVQVMDFLLRRHDYRHQSDAADLVLLDLNMPLMDGFQVLKEIRSNDSLKKVPVYVITVSRQTDDWNRALDLGASGFYNKGSSITDLRRVIREVCNSCIGTLS